MVVGWVADMAAIFAMTGGVVVVVVVVSRVRAPDDSEPLSVVEIDERCSGFKDASVTAR